MKDYFVDLSKNNEKYSMKNSLDLSTSNATPAPIPMTSGIDVVVGVLDLTKESIRCFTEYSKCKEHEITERKKINATLRAIQYQIDAQKEVYLKELDRNFEERNRLYDMAEKTQERALALGDIEMLQTCYNFILNVYNTPYSTKGSMILGINNSFNS